MSLEIPKSTDLFTTSSQRGNHVGTSTSSVALDHGGTNFADGTRPYGVRNAVVQKDAAWLGPSA